MKMKTKLVCGYTCCVPDFEEVSSFVDAGGFIHFRSSPNFEACLYAWRLYISDMRENLKLQYHAVENAWRVVNKYHIERYGITMA
jgi:hypothetical protein